MKLLLEDRITDVLEDVIPTEENIISDNPRVREVITRLSDESVIERIIFYSETHDRWEKSAGW